MVMRMIRNRRENGGTLQVPLTVILALLLFIPLLIPAVSSGGATLSSSAQTSAQDYSSIASFMRSGQMSSYLTEFNKFVGTATGYPGYSSALDFVASSLRSMGYDVEYEPYQVVMPVDTGSEVIAEKDGQRIEIAAYAVWPNLVQTSKTPPGGVSGTLVYVGSGSLEEMEGKDIDGNIVMMDLDSGSNWLNAVEFGAKALIYLEGEMKSVAVQEMVVRSPLYFPRVCVPRRDVDRMKALEGSQGTVVNGMEYKAITAENIIAKLEGTQIHDEVVAIGCHLDSWSPVPGLSSPASEAASVAALLELARYFSVEKPARTLWITVFSGHYEALAGARAFAEDFLAFEDKPSEIPKLNPERKKLLAFFGLDLTTETSYMDLLYAGFLYNYVSAGSVTKYQSWLEPLIFSSIVPALTNELGIQYNQIVEDGFRSEGWWGSSAQPYMLDSEPFSIAHCLGFTLRTGSTFWPLFGTTSQTSREYDIDNLVPQAALSVSIADQLCNNLGLPINWGSIGPKRVFGTTSLEVAGLTHITGSVMMFNLTKSWYTPVPGALVVTNREQTTPLLFGDIMTFADSSGRFNITGAGMGYALGGVTVTYGVETVVPGYYIQAFVVNSTNGAIEYAPDLGDYGARAMSFWASADTYPYEARTIVFRCSSAAFVNLVDPTKLGSPTVFDPRFTSRYWINIPSDLEAFDAKTISAFISWGMIRAPEDKAIVIFGPSDSRFKLMSRFGPERSMAGFLTNSSTLVPDGSGYGLVEGSQTLIKNVALAIAKDMYYTTLARYLPMNASFVRRSSVESGLSQAFANINAADTAVRGGRYAMGKSYSLLAFGWADSTYVETMSLLMESSVTSIVFFLILAPFCFLFEGLALVRKGMSRLAALVGLLVAGLLVFYFLNPSLRVAQNAFIGFLGLGLSFLLGIVLVVIANESIRTVSYYRIKAEGQHRIEESKLSTSLFSFELSLSNMRKRKMRTLLLVATVAIVVFGLTSLTSTEVFTMVQVTPSETAAPYNGLYLKQGDMRPADFLGRDLEVALERIKNYGVIVAPRAIYYPQSVVATQVFSNVLSGTGSYRINAAVGMSPEQIDVHPAINSCLIAGGRWFIDGDYLSVILCRSAMDQLHVEIGSSVQWEGLTLTVVGSVNETLLNREFIELDQRPATPLDPNKMVATIASQTAAGEEKFEKLSWDSVLMLPYRLVMDLGGSLSSISVRSEDPDTTVMLAKELAMTVDVEVNAGVEGQIVHVSRLLSTILGGYQFLIFPLVVAGGTIMNSLLGLLRERENETKIFSSLGLSPWGIGVLYISEVLTLVIIGTLIGYLGGLATNAMLISLRLLPSSFVLNFSSVFIILSLGITMIAALLSALYPAILASRLATPSLERKWRISTKPVNNRWEIPLPFSFPTKEEATGLLNYLEEFAQVHSVETAERFQVRAFGLDTNSMKLEMTVALAPYEANVLQTATVVGHETFPEQKWEFELALVQTSGERSVWMTANYDFVDSTRKQFLLWRSLTTDGKMSYIEKT